MPYVFGNSYGDVYNNLLATQQADVNQYNRFADFAQRQQQQDIENQFKADDLATRQAQTMYDRGQANRDWQWKTQHAADELALERGRDTRADAEWQWRKQTPTATAERAAELKFKAALEQADTGELTDEVLKSLPKDHQLLLKAHNDRMKGKATKADEAADVLNRTIALQHYVAESGADQPNYIFPDNANPQGLETAGDVHRRRGKMQGDIKDWKEELETVGKRAEMFKKDPELMAHLKLDDNGWWVPALQQPGTATRPFAPPPTLPDTPVASAKPKVTVATGNGVKPAMPSTQADFDSLPSGAMFVNPADGRVMRKK